MTGPVRWFVVEWPVRQPRRLLPLRRVRHRPEAAPQGGRAMSGPAASPPHDEHHHRRSTAMTHSDHRITEDDFGSVLATYLVWDEATDTVSTVEAIDADEFYVVRFTDGNGHVTFLERYDSPHVALAAAMHLAGWDPADLIDGTDQ